MWLYLPIVSKKYPVFLLLLSSLYDCVVKKVLLKLCNLEFYAYLCTRVLDERMFNQIY